MTSHRLLIAMDAFKGSLKAEQACEAVKQGLELSRLEAVVHLAPMADGGEGSLDVLLRQLPGGRREYRKVMGPLTHMQVRATFGWWPETRLAVIEAASACGLPLLEPAQKAPMDATSFGVGQLIGAAYELIPKRIILAVGGTASMDAGFGAARALGWQGFDAKGQPVPHGARGLDQIACLKRPATTYLESLEVWCDVDAPLTGPKGAAAVFGPQKGATHQEIARTDRAFKHLAHHPLLVNRMAMIDAPGSGAAGGLAWGAALFSGANLKAGAKHMADIIDLETQIKQADHIIAGEGCFDRTSLRGKCISEIARLARKHGKKLWILAGSIMIDVRALDASGGLAATPKGISVTKAMRQPLLHLKNAAQQLGNLILDKDEET